MDVTQAEALCAGLPGAWPDNPWDHEHPVIKVGEGERGKIFAFLGEDRVGIKGGPSREAADDLAAYGRGAALTRYPLDGSDLSVLAPDAGPPKEVPPGEGPRVLDAASRYWAEPAPDGGAIVRRAPRAGGAPVGLDRTRQNRPLRVRAGAWSEPGSAGP